MNKSQAITVIRKWGPAAIALTAVLIVAIVYHRPIVAWFGGDPDALFGSSSTSPHVQVGELHQAGSLKVGAQVEPRKPIVGKNRLYVAVQTTDGKPVTDARVEAVAIMPAMGAMPEMRATATMKHEGQGRYTGELELAMQGGWPLTVKIDSPSNGQVTVYFDLATTIEGIRLTSASGAGGEKRAVASPHAESGKAPINNLCPVLKNEVPAGATTLTWNGHTIGFCCPGCDTKFNSWSDEKKQAFVDPFIKAEGTSQQAGSKTGPINDVCPILGNEVPADAKAVTWQSHTIGFCCPPCEADWNKLSDEKKKAFVDRFMKESKPQAGDHGGHDMPMPPKEGIAFWTCAMHPSVKSKDDGTCPICKMDLAPVTHEEVQSGVIFVDSQRRQLIGVRTTTVMEQNLEKSIRAVGLVTYDETRLTDVTLKYRGWIGELFADYTGKHVKQGEPLLTIYSPELLSAQQEYLDARAATEVPGRTTRVADAARERLLLWDLTEQQLEELATRGKPLQYIPVLSPATGTIIHKMAVKGSAVEPGKMIYRIADLSAVWVEAELYEDDIPFVKVGQKVDVSVSYLSARKFEGSVSYIYPYLDPKTRRGRVRIEVANDDGALKPDMYASVYIHVAIGKRLAVPEEAVLYGGQNNVVFLDLGEGRLRPQRVKLGMRAAAPGLGIDLIEVTDGLKPGDTVVSSGNFLIASESKLKSGIEKW